MERLRIGDQVMTPRGRGEIITIPTGKSRAYVVLLAANGRAVLFDISEIKKGGDAK